MKRKYDVDAWRQFHLLRQASFHPDTTKADIAVLAEIIQRYHGEYGNGWASHEHLAGMAGVTKATVKRSRRSLAKLGFITILETGRRGRATVYLPNFDMVPQKGVILDPLSMGVAGDPLIDSLGVTDDPETEGYGVADDPPSYLRDRPTRAESQESRIDTAAPTAPPGSGLDGRPGADAAAGGFDELYKAYGYKRNRADARAAYDALGPDAILHGDIMAAATAWRLAWEAQGKADAPRKHLASWITRECYLEDPPTPYKAKAKAKAKANAPAKAKPDIDMPTSEPDDDIAEDDDEVADNDEDDAPRPMVNDVDVWSPFGRFMATIEGSAMKQEAAGTLVMLHLRLVDEGGKDRGKATHSFYSEAHDEGMQSRGQAHLYGILGCLGLDGIDDVKELHGKKLKCSINDRLAISYEPSETECDTETMTATPTYPTQARPLPPSVRRPWQ